MAGVRRMLRGPVAWAVGAQLLAAAALGIAVAGGNPAFILFSAACAVCVAVMGVSTLWLVWRRRRAEKQLTGVRPRFGTLRLRSGIVEPVVCHPVAPDVFVACHAGDESPVVLRHGDAIEADVIGPGQAIVMKRGDMTG